MGVSGLRYACSARLSLIAFDQVMQSEDNLRPKAITRRRDIRKEIVESLVQVWLQ